jgi:predicted negative regulator of RcsB-dependent stress response
MDEDTAIINTNNRNQKIKDFLVNNKKILILIIFVNIFILISYFGIEEFKERKKIKISNQYNEIIGEYSDKNKEVTKKKLINLINKKDSTYSPLSLYFIIDNNLDIDQSKINNLFNIIIDDVSLEKEIKNLIIYKKALYNAESSNENQLLEILKPVINSKSVWKSHGLYLLAEYFFSKNEKEKAKEFFNKIILLENANRDIVIESQKRLNRDLGE